MAFTYCYKSDKIMDEIIEVKCTNCCWKGKEADLKQVPLKGIICCPNCYCKEIEPIEGIDE